MILEEAAASVEVDSEWVVFLILTAFDVSDD